MYFADRNAAHLVLCSILVDDQEQRKLIEIEAYADPDLNFLFRVNPLALGNIDPFQIGV